MTRLESLRALHDAVKAGKPCVIPSPKQVPRDRGETARIMGYAEGYAMVRHKGCGPFVVSVTEILAILAALIAQEQAP